MYKVSIIIPCKKINEYTRQCIAYCKRLELYNSKCELIVLPDSESEGSVEGVKVIPTGPLTPGAKRNIGVKNAEGDVLAFIDSDAYPRQDWTRNALKYLNDVDGVVAVGGPGLTPPEDSFMQKASGLVLSSRLVGGLAHRYKLSEAFKSDDIHSCNFIIYRYALEKVGGWNEKYWPGEDTLLCLELRRAGWELLETPDVVVYHHRKPLFKEHLKQVWRFGIHRGFFAKRFRGNSLKVEYFVPSSLLIFLVVGLIISAFSGFWFTFFTSIVVLYVLACMIAAMAGARKSNIRLFPFIWLGIIATHLAYGVAFLLGGLKRNLKK
jgi:cellulose synthase/poly-beta-1,6-N-acetylglucosamine synthase-like glycosyltransferase